jgi:bifunctional DNA-binding transcriptional regulator/antitoxin component of YhaV-PrlF toxin-antitoxin module
MAPTRREIKPGDFLQSKAEPLAVREVLGLKYGDWYYVEYWTDGSEMPIAGACSANQLQRWGEHITTEQAAERIYDLDGQRQLMKLEVRWELRQRLKDVNDKLLIAELVRRGYIVTKKPTN